MTVEHRDAMALERVPHVDGVVIVAAEQNSARNGKVDGVDAEQNGFFGVTANLAIGTQVKEPT